MKRALLFLLAGMLALLAGAAASGLAADGAPVGNFGFIPNSGEASVSKVDLINGTEVARYYTAPRDGVPPYAWRTSRIAIDADGNAWVLNVGSDAYLKVYPGPAVTPADFGSYDPYVPAEGLIGAVVRVQANTTGLSNTNTDPSNPLPFGTEEAVKVFPVGAVGEMPRAIAVDLDGFIWVGFYGGGYFQKYQYAAGSLTAVGDPVSAPGYKLAPYDAAVDQNGILWFTSKQANPSLADPTLGVFSFDTKSASPVMTLHQLVNPGPPPVIENPYDLTIDNANGKVWVTTQTAVVFEIPLSGDPMTRHVFPGGGFRGMAVGEDGTLWLASSSQSRVYYITTTGAWSSFPVCPIPVGIGPDAEGFMWVVCRNDDAPAGLLQKFDPMGPRPPAILDEVTVGFRPYAYGGFAVPAIPAIDIIKYTNGEDANDPTGPFIPVGGAVDWTYAVTNIGNVDLVNVTVTDDQDVEVNCPKTALAVGESMTCTASGVAVAGQYANTGTVTGAYDGSTVTDSDPSHYFGSAPAIDIEKLTNGEDADNPTGPFIPVGNAVNWTYVVTNIGNVDLTNVVVTDDKGVTVTCPKTALAVGESMTCAASGTATAGQYANVGSVTGTPPVGGNVMDSDPSHYFGQAFEPLTVEKTAAGTFDRTVRWTLEKSASPTTLSGEAGQSAGSTTWTVVATKTETLGNYQVTGEITITNPNDIPVDFEVSDTLSDGTVADVTCPAYIVPAGGSVTCTYSASPADGSATSNTATVTSKTPGVDGAADTAAVSFTENLIGYDSGLLSDQRSGFSGTISGSTTKQFPEEFFCPADASFYVNGAYSFDVTNTATLDSNIGLSDDATVTVNCTKRQTGVLLPTNVSCQMYASGNWPAMYESFYYGLKNGKINNVSPGVMFYYDTIQAPASGDIVVAQTNTANWRPFTVHQGQAYLYDNNCNKVAVGTETLGAQATVTFGSAGLTAGKTYYIGIKYSPKDMPGQAVPLNGATQTEYFFSTKIDGVLQSGSEDSITLLPR